MLFPLVKVVGSIGVGIGSTVITNGVVKAVTPVVANKVMNVCIQAGGMFLSAAITTIAVDQFIKTVDSIETVVNATKKKIHDKKMETVEEGA